MKAIRFLAAALVAATGLVLSTPDANAGHRDVEKKAMKRWHGGRWNRQPQYRVTYKWVWNSYDRNWEWRAVYEPLTYGYGRYYEYEYQERHDHPFPEHDGHRHGDGCGW